MPFRRKRFRKKRFSKMRKIFKTKYDRIQDNRTKKLAKFVYRTIEPKQVTRFINSSVQGLNSTSWYAHDLTEIPFAVGSENNERIGNTVTIQSIKMSFVLKNMIPQYNTRCVVIQFPNNQLLTPTSSNPLGLPVDIQNMAAILQFNLYDTQAPPVAFNQDVVIMSPYKVGSNTRFRILHDKVYSAPNASYNTVSGASVGTSRVVNLNLTPKGPGKVLSFKVGSVQNLAVKNRIIAFWINNKLVGDQSRYPIGICSRMTYRDA